MILNEIERAVICGTREYRTNADFIDAIEGAVLNKLCAGVEKQEPVAHILPRDLKILGFKGMSVPVDALPYSKSVEDSTSEMENTVPLYTATAIAASRLRALESAAVVCERTNTYGDVLGGWIPEIAKNIRALRGEA